MMHAGRDMPNHLPPDVYFRRSTAIITRVNELRARCRRVSNRFMPFPSDGKLFQQREDVGVFGDITLKIHEGRFDSEDLAVFEIWFEGECVMKGTLDFNNPSAAGNSIVNWERSGEWEHHLVDQD